MNTLFVIQHEKSTPPGTINDWAKLNNINMKVIRIDLGDELPENVTTNDGVIVLGGSMDTHETEKHPWIINEKKFILNLLDKDIPLLGICLGSQLLGECVGAVVSQNPVWEIGWIPVHFNKSVYKEPSVCVAHFHRYRVEANENIEVNGSSTHCNVQSYQVKGKRAIGVQFHPEADEKWFGNFKYPQTAEINDVNVQTKEKIEIQGRECSLKAQEYFFHLLTKHFLD